MKEPGVFHLRRKLFGFIIEGRVDKEVVDELAPGGEPHEFEKNLWDYKLNLPTLPKSFKPGSKTLAEYNSKFAEIIKDAVSFYNSRGGYLLVGISDSPRSLEGFSLDFDCDELNKRIKSDTGHDVDCHYKKHSVDKDGIIFTVGLLFIPKRQDGVSPAQFKKTAPKSESGKVAYHRGDMYFRDGCECRPATTADDFAYICSQGCRDLSYSETGGHCKILNNNLGEKDPGFIKFIGRENYLTDLWKWLFDKYTPIKLLTGLGGVGKTTLAREFVEDVIRSSPINYETVIWLSAKQQFYTAIMDEFKPATRVAFHDCRSLLLSILDEAGWPENQIDNEWGIEELMDHVVETISECPVLLIVDDVDSLELSEQNDVFQTIHLLFGQTIGRVEVPSKAILTARLELGAAPNQFITVRGLNYEEFIEYIEMASSGIDFDIKIDHKSKLIQKFHGVTDGSPTFAASIIRLLSKGATLGAVLNDWKGSAGEEVRNFAFQKELNNLTDSQLRTLYVGCILGETSLLELQQITLSNETLLKDDIGELKQYHLISIGGDVIAGGAQIIIPNSIRIMTDLIKNKIPDPRRLEKECAKYRANSPNLENKIGIVVYRVIALWKEHDYDQALDVARWGNKKYKDNADLKCLLGRAYMNIDPPNHRLADTMFRRAYELNCKRPEQFELWIAAKKRLKDWVGLIEVTKNAGTILGKDEYVYTRIEAFGNAAEAARAAGNLHSTAEFFFKGAKEIVSLFHKKRHSARLHEFKDIKEYYFVEYVKAVDQMQVTRKDYLETWLAAWNVYMLKHISIPIVEFANSRLSDWWDSVNEREVISAKTVTLFRIQVERLSEMVNFFSKHKAQYRKLWIKGEEQLRFFTEELKKTQTL